MIAQEYDFCHFSRNFFAVSASLEMLFVPFGARRRVTTQKAPRNLLTFVALVDTFGAPV